MADQPIQADRFKPEMPRIPGVNDARPQSSSSPKPAFKLVLSLVVLAAIGGLAWRFLTPRGNSSTPAAEIVEPLPEAPPVAKPAPVLPSAPGPVATLEELAQPWAAKKFTFVKPDTHEVVPAMVVRLPGIAGNRSTAYWAFALAPPFGRCDLDYVTDPKELAARFGYSSTHPMLAAACNGSLYDPLRMSVVGSGAWVRGEVVQGPGIRPPTAIRIQVSGHSIVADRIE